MAVDTLAKTRYGVFDRSFLPRGAVVKNEYRTNRAQFPRAELDKYRGRWVAFRADGRQIVASAQTVERLEELLSGAGEDPQRVVFEYLPGPEDDPDLDGVEFL
jgi:hypothetical protein